MALELFTDIELRRANNSATRFYELHRQVTMAYEVCRAEAQSDSYECNYVNKKTALLFTKIQL